MRTQYTPKIIFSVFNTCNSYHENSNHHWAVKKALEMAGISFVEADGKYNGTTEKSLVIKDTEQNRRYAMMLASNCLQESILLIDNEGTGYLHYMGSDKQHKLGVYEVYTEEPEGDYTKIGEDYIIFK